ncbi:TetR/AcrR family transcriptional regulator [Marinivivus vitaminiproducens]|uniref:TetR/AcrR family transcriptional regulator n=1 Tax=Marinivivus vitaminiproducens TaxID=3035935 RepID=UPI0027A24972|nr:TetR/AcrR family transcriptional regulator [Geminicoccaceae bacterium SCSIO 64248]
MRVSRDVAVQNRQKVVETAGRAFREQGYDGIGVAGLMRAAGLTHGGFYKQFADKEALAAEATATALRDNLAKWVDVIDGTDGDPLGALADRYLSPAHVKRRDVGCTFAALAAEAPRHGPEMTKVFAEALEAWVSTVAEAAPVESRADILKAISTMLGALILARAVGDDAMAREILDAASRSSTS